MKKVYWFTVLWPSLIGILIVIDTASNLWITNALFTSTSLVAGAVSSIIALVGAVFPLLAKKLSSEFLNKVDVEVLGITRERAIVAGFG